MRRSVVLGDLNMQFVVRCPHSHSKTVFLDASLFVRGASVRWRGVSYAADAAAAPSLDSSSSEIKKTGKRVPKDERKAMVRTFVDKYRAMNSGKFPTYSVARNEVGGSYYVIRRIVQELEYEWKMTSLNMKGGAQINDTKFKGLEAVEGAGTSNAGEETVLRGMETASTTHKKGKVNLKQKVTDEDELRYDVKPWTNQQQQSGTDAVDSSNQYIEEELGPQISIAAECASRESHLLVMETKHLLDSQTQNTEANLHEVSSAEERQNSDSMNPLDQQQQLTGAVPVGLENSSIQHHEDDDCNIATREIDLRAAEAKHDLDVHPEKPTDNLNEKKTSQNEINSDGWKPMAEEQQPSEMQKVTRDLANEKDIIEYKENPSGVWNNLKSFADGIISFWRKL